MGYEYNLNTLYDILKQLKKCYAFKSDSKTREDDWSVSIITVICTNKRYPIEIEKKIRLMFVYIALRQTFFLQLECLLDIGRAMNASIVKSNLSDPNLSIHVLVLA